MRRKDPPLYRRNKGKCHRCGSEVGSFAVITFPHGNINEVKYMCHACLVKALLTAESPSPKKKEVPDAYKGEVPENKPTSP